MIENRNYSINLKHSKFSLNIIALKCLKFEFIIFLKKKKKEIEFPNS